jgi:Double zinc ribbon
VNAFNLLGASAFGSVHDLLHSTAFVVGRNLALFLAFVFWLGFAYWVYRDARRRIDDPWLTGTATLLGLSVPYVGPLIYLLFRPPETLAEVRTRDLELLALEEQLGHHALQCPVCRLEVEPSFLLCPVCTTRLKRACVRCSAVLEPEWQLCPYCATAPVAATPELVAPDLDAALTAEAAAKENGHRAPTRTSPV